MWPAVVGGGQYFILGKSNDTSEAETEFEPQEDGSRQPAPYIELKSFSQIYFQHRSMTVRSFPPSPIYIYPGCPSHIPWGI